MDAAVFLVPFRRLPAGFTVAFFGLALLVEARALDSGLTAERERPRLATDVARLALAAPDAPRFTDGALALTVTRDGFGNLLSK